MYCRVLFLSPQAWSSHMLASGSRDKSVLLRDVRVPEHYIDKLAGHRSEVCGLKVRQGTAWWTGAEAAFGLCAAAAALVHASGLECCRWQQSGTVCCQRGVCGASRDGKAVLACRVLYVSQWSPDDKMLASGGNDNALILWQVCVVCCVQVGDPASRL